MGVKGGGVPVANGAGQNIEVGGGEIGEGRHAARCALLDDGVNVALRRGAETAGVDEIGTAVGSGGGGTVAGGALLAV